MITLAISHHIYINDEDRYALVKGNTIETTGVSVPVWFFKGTTSEPAVEVFCKYILTNTSEDYPVTSFAKGYQINLPQITSGHKIALRPENWKDMTLADQEKWSKEHPCPPLSVDLLDIKDGGLKCIKFKKYNKIKENNKRLNAIHAVEINTIQWLVSSLNY